MTACGTTRPSARRPSGLALGVAFALAGASCGSLSTPSGPSTPSSVAGPSRSPGPAGLDWVEAATVERPEGMAATPPSIPPVGDTGGLGHPGHFSGQGHPLDVAAGRDQQIAVGYTFPEFRGVTWTSADRATWTLAEVSPGQTETFVLSVAAGSGDRWVAVGRHGGEAAAWWSPDGRTWTSASAPGDAFDEPPETRMTAVLTTPSGVLAGGWAGLITGPGRARFWTSPDGATWTRLAHEAGFDDGRVASIAAGPGGYVAVGTTGRVGRATGSAVWRSIDGLRWQRVPTSATLAAGSMTSVTAGGPGYVAVGASLDSKKVLVWLSSDGATWTLAPGQESLTYHGLRIAMADVTAGADGTLVAVGHFLFGTQYGQGTTWTSRDGQAWTRADDLATLGQAEPAAVIADGSGYVAVGTVGAPDNFIPKVWLSPPGR